MCRSCAVIQAKGQASPYSSSTYLVLKSKLTHLFSFLPHTTIASRDRHHPASAHQFVSQASAARTAPTAEMLTYRGSTLVPTQSNGTVPAQALSDCGLFAPPTRSAIAVLTWSNRVQSFQPVEQVVCAYCKRHGYDRLISQTPRSSFRSPAWEKIPFLLEMLPLYQAILHLDDDAVVGQLERPIEDILYRHPTRDMLLSAVENLGRQWQGSPKTGVFIVRSTPFMFNLLKQMMSSPECAPYHNKTQCCPEQDCLWQLITGHVGVMRAFFYNKTSPIGFLMSCAFDCRDDHASWVSRFHFGHCRNPFAFHAMGQPKHSYIKRKAQLLLGSVASREGWTDGRVNLTNWTWTPGYQLSEWLKGCPAAPGRYGDSG